MISDFVDLTPVLVEIELGRGGMERDGECLILNKVPYSI